MAPKSRLGQTEERWISILDYLGKCVESLDTRKIAEYIGCDTAPTGNILRQMEKKGLIKSRKIGRKKEWWVERPSGSQYSFFQELTPSIRPSLKRVVRRARKRRGTNARGWISVKRGKESFARSPEVSQAKITWNVADKILTTFVGSPDDLRIKLSWGAGSTAEWKCGCRVITSWKHARADIHECGLPVCLRNVALSRKETKTTSIPIAECTFTFVPPEYMPMGRTYTLTCGCLVVVAEVVYVTGIKAKAGVLANGIGIAICAKHKTPRV